MTKKGHTGHQPFVHPLYCFFSFPSLCLCGFGVRWLDTTDDSVDKHGDRRVEEVGECWDDGKPREGGCEAEGGLHVVGAVLCEEGCGEGDLSVDEEGGDRDGGEQLPECGGCACDACIPPVPCGFVC